MKKYSPPPWKWTNTDRYDYMVASDGTKVFESATYEGMWLSYNENRECNALLMESAPEVLEALLKIIDEYETAPPLELVQRVFFAIEDAKKIRDRFIGKEERETKQQEDM